MPQELNPNIQFRSLIADLSENIDEAILAALETDVSDTLLASLAEARGGIVRMNHAVKIVTISIANDQPRVYADELPEGARPKPLPPVKQPQSWAKQRPGIQAKLRGPKTFDCPTCHAEAGTFCFTFSSQGKHGVITDQRNTGSTFHSARYALSTAYNNKMRAEYDRAANKAHQPIEDTKGTNP